MGICLGISMPVPFKKCFPQHLSNQGFLCMNNSSSHVASSTSRFFHLTRYSVTARFLSFLILFSRIVFGSSMIFPSSLSSGKLFFTGILFLITFFDYLLYGYHPPSITSPLKRNTKVQVVEEHIGNQQEVLKLLKDNLVMAQNRMKHQ
jgi:hypothetical protein